MIINDYARTMLMRKEGLSGKISVLVVKHFRSPNYFITDHLGGVRMVVNGSGEFLQRNRYYPYGERMASWTPSLTNNDYLYPCMKGTVRVSARSS